MTPVVLTLLVVGGGGLVLWLTLSPLWNHDRVAEDAAHLSGLPAPSITALLDDSDAALAGLAELDFDRALGNLSEEEYQTLRSQYRSHAIGVLKALDAADAQGVGRASGKSQRNGKTKRAPMASRVTVSGGGRSHAEGNPLSRRAQAAIASAALAAVVATVAISLTLRSNAVTPRHDGQFLGFAQFRPGLKTGHARTALLVPGTQVVLVGHDEGLLRSADGGGSWQPVATVKGEVLALSGASTEGRPLFLATRDAVLRSADAGLTWEALPLPRSGAQIGALAAGAGVGDTIVLYAEVAGTGLFRTTNGRDWELMGQRLPSGVSALVWQPGPKPTLYAATLQNGVLASDNEGRTWGTANGALAGALPTMSVRALAVDPNSGDQFTGAGGTVMAGAMYAGTDRGVFKSIDGGSSWRALALTEPVTALGVRSSPDALMIAVDDRRQVWWSRDRGASWSGKP